MSQSTVPNGTLPPSTNIANIYIEFFDVSDPNLVNHACLKLDFASPVATTAGVRIDMDINYDDAESTPETCKGTLTVKPLPFIGPSAHALRSIRLSNVKLGLVLGDIISAISETHLDEFVYLARNNRWYGCRDFLIQLVFVLEARGYLRTENSVNVRREPELASGNVYAALGYLYGAGWFRSSAIVKGEFEQYQRVIRPGMPY